MKLIRLTIGFLVLIGLSCTNPTENIKLVIDTDIIKYTAMLQVTNAQTGAQAPNNATITILGENDDDVYEISGKKQIKLVQGMVNIGLHPNVVPTAQVPITITVEIAAPGYVTQRRIITFTEEMMQQIVPIRISEVGNTAPPVVIPPPLTYQDISLNFTGRCPNRPDVEIRPSVYVSFKKSGSTEGFTYLGYMEKGDITTNLLALGETYNFQIVYGGESYVVTQKIEQTNYKLSLDMTAACNF